MTPFRDLVETESHTDASAEYERKLLALREALAHGEASGEVEGDIFLQVAAKYGLSLIDED